MKIGLCLFAVFYIARLVGADLFVKIDRQEFLKELQKIKSPDSFDTLWDNKLAGESNFLAKTCFNEGIENALKIVVNKSKDGVLSTALKTWIENGKTALKQNCNVPGCNDYFALTGSLLMKIGCGYHDCPGLGGTFVVCKHISAMN